MEYNNNETNMLVQFFEVEALLGKHFPAARVFSALAGVYCLPRGKQKAMMALAQLEEVRDIISLADYNRTARALDYRERYGEPMALSDDVRFALDCKGKALRVINELAISCGKDPSRNQLVTGLSCQTIGNKVDIAALAAFLYYEGIVLPCDKVAAKENVLKCLRWNNVGGILLALHYGEGDRHEVLCTLYTIVNRMRCMEDYDAVFARYGREGLHEVEAPILLASYFDYNVEEAATYDDVVANIIASPFLGIGDKRRALSGTDKSIITHLCDLAVGSEIRRIDPNRHLRQLVASGRLGEANQIEVYLRKQNTDMGRVPLLVSGDSVATHNYLTAVEQLVGVQDVTFIDGKTCARNSFLPAKSNVVVQALLAKNSACNVFVVTDVDCLTDADAEQLAAMVNPKGRKAFMLQDVGVPVDLSNSVFLLCASGEVGNGELRKVCHSIAIARASAEESLAYVRMVIAKNKAVYECTNLSFDEGAVAFLAERNANYVNSVVEGLSSAHTYGDEVCVLTKDDVINAAVHIGDRHMAFAIK